MAKWIQVKDKHNHKGIVNVRTDYIVMVSDCPPQDDKKPCSWLRCMHGESMFAEETAESILKKI